MNNVKQWLLIGCFLFVCLGCSEDNKATVDVVKKRAENAVQEIVGKEDIALQKYENKIQQIRDKLIRVKVAVITYEKNLEAKKQQLAELEQANDLPEKIAILKNTIPEMETLLGQLKFADTRIEEVLKTLVQRKNIMRMKIDALEAKRDMLQALKDAKEDTVILEQEVDSEATSLNGSIEDAIKTLEEEITRIEAEIAVDNLIRQASL